MCGTLLCAGLLAGCASSQPEPIRDEMGYEPRVASALVMTPPVVKDYVDTEAFDDVLARPGREQTAFLGYDSPTLMTLDVITRDYQGMGYTGGGFGGYGSGGFGYYGFGGGTGGLGDYYSRRAISTRSFTRVR